MNKVIVVITTLLMGSFLMGASCWTNIDKTDSPDASTHDASWKGDCTGACANLKRLKCPEGDTLPDGTTCEMFCMMTVEMGHSMNTSCVASATSCERVHSVCGM